MIKYRTQKHRGFLPKCIHVTRGAGDPLTLQSKRAVPPSMTSRMSSLRVNRGSLDGATLRFAVEVNSSANATTRPFDVFSDGFFCF